MSATLLLAACRRFQGTTQSHGTAASVVVGPHAYDQTNATWVQVAPLIVGRGKTAYLGSVVQDSSGTALAKVATYTSGDPNVATVDAAGKVTGVAAGTCTITATADGQSGTVLVTVQIESADPAPGVGATVLLDTRSGGAQDIQAAASISEALTASGLTLQQAGTADWTTDMDGAGTHAIRHDMIAVGHGDIGGMTVEGAILPAVDEIYVQYKFYLSRHPLDSTPGTVGRVGSWTLWTGPNPASFDGLGQAKRLLILRSPANSRADYVWHNSRSPITTGSRTSNSSLEGWYGVTNPLPTQTPDWIPEQYVGRLNTLTMHLIKSSADGVADGSVEVWMNGKVLYSNLGGASVGVDQISKFQFPTTVSDPSQQQTEYFWDILAWTP